MLLIGKVWQTEGLRSSLDSFLIPKALWGVGIVEVADEPDARAIGKNDPAVKAGLTFEIYPMPGAVVRKWKTIQAVKSTETYRKGSSFFSKPK